MKRFYAGIDAGSTYVKAVLLDENENLAGYGSAITGVDAGVTAKKLIDNICSDNDINADQIEKIISTGYSRRNIEGTFETVTEIQAHARGAGWSAPEGINVRTVIDIGGQDSKVIVLDEQGGVFNFVMNDKCAAGTGRFLESLSRALEIEVDRLGPLSLESTVPITINSTCVVFAESEVISLLVRKKKQEDIVAGIHMSLAKRIGSMARKAGFAEGVLLTGGGGLNSGIAGALEDELLCDVNVPEYPQLNGAIGAALIAKDGEGC
ncbi:MAG: benzoyl-CoA reductase [Spirochaetes bacterium]|nr:benzoyl-CoA reductase [Spirochaetota bacterium]